MHVHNTDQHTKANRQTKTELKRQNCSKCHKSNRQKKDPNKRLSFLKINEAVNFPRLPERAQAQLRSAAKCGAVRRASSPPAAASVWLPTVAHQLPSQPAVSSPINKTYFSLAWLSDGTLLLLPLAYMLAESCDCHAPVNPSQPPRAQPRHHGDTRSVLSHWMACSLRPPTRYGNHHWVTSLRPRPHKMLHPRLNRSIFLTRHSLSRCTSFPSVCLKSLSVRLESLSSTLII